MRKLTTLVAVALMAIAPAAADAHKRHDGVKQARAACKAERQQDKAAFKAKYGNKNGKHAFRRCVRQHAGDPVGEQGSGEQG